MAKMITMRISKDFCNHYKKCYYFQQVFPDIYYFIPSNPLEPAIVSTESFISRAHRANPQAAERVLLPKVISDAIDEQEAVIESMTGQPKWKTANLQDLRDVVTIVRGYKGFVKEIIQRTPSINWGRPGLTE